MVYSIGMVKVIMLILAFVGMVMGILVSGCMLATIIHGYTMTISIQYALPLLDYYQYDILRLA